MNNNCALCNVVTGYGENVDLSTILEYNLVLWYLAARLNCISSMILWCFKFTLETVIGQNDFPWHGLSLCMWNVTITDSFYTQCFAFFRYPRPPSLTDSPFSLTLAYFSKNPRSELHCRISSVNQHCLLGEGWITAWWCPVTDWVLMLLDVLVYLSSLYIHYIWSVRVSLKEWSSFILLISPANR